MTITDFTSRQPNSVDFDVPGGFVSMKRAGTGAPALFLHSAGGARVWTPLHDAISAHRDLIAPDHPGFGLSSDFPDIKSMKGIAEHYLRVLDLLDLDAVDLIGASLGGWAAAELATTAPDRIRTLTLMCPAGLDVPDAPVTNLFRLTPKELVEHLFHSQTMIDAALAVTPTEDGSAAMARDMSTLAYIASDPVLCDPTLRDRLPQITARTLVVAAEHDRIIPRCHTDIYAAEIPDARLITVENAGHILDGENPGPVITACISFLSEAVGMTDTSLTAPRSQCSAGDV